MTPSDGLNAAAGVPTAVTIIGAGFAPTDANGDNSVLIYECNPTDCTGGVGKATVDPSGNFSTTGTVENQVGNTPCAPPNSCFAEATQFGAGGKTADHHLSFGPGVPVTTTTTVSPVTATTTVPVITTTTVPVTTTTTTTTTVPVTTTTVRVTTTTRGTTTTVAGGGGQLALTGSSGTEVGVAWAMGLIVTGLFLVVTAGRLRCQELRGGPSDVDTKISVSPGHRTPFTSREGTWP